MSDFVTVVSGLPRSGTSLMMQMLAAGGMPVLTDGIRAADEDNPRGYLEFEAVKRTKEDAAWVAEARGRAVKMVYLLLQDLPAGYDYRVVLMRRDVREVLASQRAMLSRLGQPGANVSEERMAAIFEREMRSVREWLAAQINFEVLEPDYRECVRSPYEVAKNVNRFLGGCLDEARMAAAVDVSLYRRSSNTAVLS
jgi:hypothetical protein